MRIGVDIGNVLADGRTSGSEQACGREVAATYHLRATVEFAEVALRQIVRHVGPGNVFLISRASSLVLSCGIGRWLATSRIMERAGVLDDHVYICAERADKARLCEQLEIDVMIDDRAEVLAHFPEGSRTRLVLFQPDDDEARKFIGTAIFDVVDDWPQVLDLLDIPIG